jgi:hypothetical protein
MCAVDFILIHGESLLSGGLTVVGIVIFIMGVLKTALINRISHKLARKIILSFLSILLVFPATVISNYAQGLGTEYLWVTYAINASATIIVYWFYENTGFRSLLELIGKTTLNKIASSVVSKESKEDFLTAIQQSQQEALTTVKKKYKDDDLKNL